MTKIQKNQTNNDVDENQNLFNSGLSGLGDDI